MQIVNIYSFVEFTVIYHFPVRIHKPRLEYVICPFAKMDDETGCFIESTGGGPGGSGNFFGLYRLYPRNANDKQGYYEVQNIPVSNIGQHYGDVNVITDGYIEFVSRTLPGGTELFAVSPANPERTLAVKIRGKYFRAIWVNDF